MIEHKNDKGILPMGLHQSVEKGSFFDKARLKYNGPVTHELATLEGIPRPG